MSSELPFRAAIASLTDMGEFELRGQVFTGAELAMQVAINPQQPVAESAATPQLIFELGRLVAAAAFEAEMAEVRYRAWRDAQIVDFTTSLEAAQEINPEATKPLPKTVAEAAVRTLSEYEEENEKRLKAAEVHATLHAAYEAARARTRAIYSFENKQGGVTRTPDEWQQNGDHPDVNPECPIGKEMGNHSWDTPGCTCGMGESTHSYEGSRYDNGVDHGPSLAEMEAAAPSASTPIPSEPVPVGPPPGSEPEKKPSKKKSKKKAAPPPPR